MSTRPAIALLIPAYNAASYLPRLLKSATCQTEPFNEIVVYDDCSTDNTAAVAKGLGARVVRGSANRGCSHGKNVLAELSTSEWIHFHDADDELIPHFVSLAQNWMREALCDVVLFPYEDRDDDTGELNGIRRFEPSDLARDARSYAIREQINPFCGLYRRSAFLRAGGYDEDPLVLYNEDVAMHIRLAFAGLSFAAETEISIINHRRLNSMSAANRLRCLQAQYHVMRKTAERPAAGPYSAEIAGRLWSIVAGLASQQDWANTDSAASLALELAGFSAVPSGVLFRALCRISPHAAVRLREYGIRALKPRFRQHYPGWRAPINFL